MNKYIKYFFISLLILLLSFGGIINAESEIMLLEDISPGQTGYAKTVFKGIEVEKFNIEVIDIVQGQNFDSKLILIKGSGQKLKNAGGIASGMSGSPVYIDDKLVGAISYKWQDADHKYALVTPILEMFNLSDSDYSLDDKLIAANTPIMVAGLNDRALDRLSDGLNIPKNRFIAGLSDAQKTVKNFSLKPGSAIAVQLVRGDISVASIGTVTYLDNELVYAFGHPFMNKGNSNYLFSGAYIDGIIPSNKQPFKVGSVLDQLLGVIEADRFSGILGRLKKYPSIIPITVDVSDRSRNVSKKVRVQIIDDEQMLRELGSSIILQSIDSTIDRIGNGTSKVNIKIMGSNLPDGEINKENMYYSSNDIAVSSLYDFYQVADLITRNPFKKINIYDIKIDIDVYKSDNIALIQKAEVLNEQVYPGSLMKVNVVLRPYRDQMVTKEVTIEIPKDINIGRATLAISGGYSGLPNRRQTEEDNGNDLNYTVIDGYKSFEEMIEAYLDGPKNNELTLQVYPSFIPKNQEMDSNQKAEEQDINNESEIKSEDNKLSQDDDEKEPEIKSQVDTDYVLEGSLTLDFEVKNLPTDDKVNNNPADTLK
ncbi:MAG: hypothetical protein K9K32_00410 [Halanaerobiales bacterium]|nr:hypothetical protein [Halanaerobiales bacterium]